jgi:hypothetical protein
MELFKKTKEYSIWKKRSGRHAVRGADGNLVHAEDKVRILCEAGVVAKAPSKKPAPEPVAEEAPAEEAAAEETPAEENAE